MDKRFPFTGVSKVVFSLILIVLLSNNITINATFPFKEKNKKNKWNKLKKIISYHHP